MIASNPRYRAPAGEPGVGPGPPIAKRSGSPVKESEPVDIATPSSVRRSISVIETLRSSGLEQSVEMNRPVQATELPEEPFSEVFERRKSATKEG